MSARARCRLFLAAGALLGLVLLVGMAGLPDAGVYRGPYGYVLNTAAPQERNTTNVVAATVLDYRAVDTLGEEFILLAAVLGVAVLLRAERGEEGFTVPEETPGHRAPAISPAVRVLGLAMVGPTVLLGLYLAAHGHLSPGGGFHGGLTLATAVLLVYLAGGFATLERLQPEGLPDVTEAAGAGGFAAIGLAAMVAGRPFLTNILPLGSLRSLASGGTIVAINVAIGMAVAGAFTLLLSELLRQLRVLRGHLPAKPPEGGR